MTRRSHRAIALALLATVALLAADLASKSWATEALSVPRVGEPPPVCEGEGLQRIRGENLVLIEGYLEFSYTENCGAAFGLLRDAPDVLRRSIFGVAALAAAIVLFVMFVQGRGGPLFAWSVPLIVSGALGNLSNRVRYGYVVDFIRFHVEDKFEYPTFNVADITITVGVALLIIDGFQQERTQKRAAAAAAEEGETTRGDGTGEPNGGRRKRKKAPAS